MDKFYLLYILSPIIVGTIVYHYRLEFLRLARTKIFLEDRRSSLFIGVLSARENTERRQLIRDSWASVLHTDPNLHTSVQLRFVVGDEDCAIPAEDREDEYSCEAWTISPEALSSDTHVTSHVSRSFLPHEHSYHSLHKVTFKVHGDVVVDKIGIHNSFISGNKVKVQLMDSFSQTVIGSQTFSAESPGEYMDGFSYKAIEPHMLPKGFEGCLLLTDNADHTLPPTYSTELSHVVRSTGGGLIQFTQSVDSESCEDSTSQPVLSLHFSPHDRSWVRAFINDRQRRTHDLQGHLQGVRSRLAQEISRHNDVLVIEDLVDVYRNLPHKLLHFLQWVHSHHSVDYVLKTDDDVFINVSQVVDRLNDWQPPQPRLWWGRFRRDWVVERVGKWAERLYSGAVYPQFACGGGYVLGSGLVEWLVHNTAELRAHQGEDVSLGIWLAAIKHNISECVGWQCSSGCSPMALSLPQLSTQEMQRLWNNYKQCHNICDCL